MTKALLLVFFLVFAVGCGGQKYASHTYRDTQGVTQAHLGSLGIKTGVGSVTRNGYSIQRPVDWFSLINAEGNPIIDPLTDKPFDLGIKIETTIIKKIFTESEFALDGKHRDVMVGEFTAKDSRDLDGHYVIKRITNLDAIAAAINATPYLKKQFLDAPKRRRIVVATVRVIKHTEIIINNKKIDMSSPGLGGESPKLLLKMDGKETEELSLGTVVAYEFARACWNCEEVMAIVPDRPGSDASDCPGSTDEPECPPE